MYTSKPGSRRRERQRDRQRAVAGVDPGADEVAAVVRFGGAVERRVLVGADDVGEAQRGDRGLGVPPDELGGDRLLGDLAEPVRVVRAGVRLVDGERRRRLVEREAHRGDARCEHDRADARAVRGEQGVERHGDVVVEGRGIRHQAVHRDRREVHEGVEPVVARGHREERVERLPEVGEVDAGEARSRRSGEVEADHVVAVGAQPLDRGPSELASAAGDADPHLVPPSVP